MTQSTIYWITRLDAIVIAMRLSPLVILLMGMIAGIILMETDFECAKFVSKIMFVLFFSLSILICFGSVFVPTTKEYCAIYAIPKIANNEKVQGEAKEIYELAKSWLINKVGESKEERK